jgi:hypothetical protein
MRRSAMRLLILTIGATAVVPVVTAIDIEASNRHVRKLHQRTSLGWNNSLRRSRATQEIRPASPSSSQGGDVCPGNARAIDCRIWPPPVVDDPDRRNGSGDGV